jgi:hypothetical protein
MLLFVLAVVAFLSSTAVAAIVGVREYRVNQTVGGLPDTPDLRLAREQAPARALLAFVAAMGAWFALTGSSPNCGLVYGTALGMVCVSVAVAGCHLASDWRYWWRIERPTGRSLFAPRNRDAAPELATARWVTASGLKLAMTYAALIALIAVWREDLWIACGAIVIAGTCGLVCVGVSSCADLNSASLALAIKSGATQVAVGLRPPLSALLSFVTTFATEFFWLGSATTIALCSVVAWTAGLTTVVRLVEIAPSVSFLVAGGTLLIFKRVAPHRVDRCALAVTVTGSITLVAVICQAITGPPS